ncbi:hypothetical protein Tco_0837535, partial [Tanacetum coccineum]
VLLHSQIVDEFKHSEEQDLNDVPADDEYDIEDMMDSLSTAGS